MEQIGELIKERANIILKGFDPLTTGGFTQVPNVLLENKNLASIAKLCYAMLLKYAWEKNYVFPGQERLAQDIGCSKPTVIKALKELEVIGYLEMRRRGQGRTNLYILYCRVKRGRG